MEKECCQIKVTELDKGYRIEITGDDVKERCNCQQLFQNCCVISPKTQTDQKADKCC